MYVTYKSSTVHLRKKSLYRYLFSQLAAPPLWEERLSVHKNSLRHLAHTEDKNFLPFECTMASQLLLFS